MRVIHIWRLALVLMIVSATFGISSYLADLINNPIFPLEAAFAVILVLLLLAAMTTLLSWLFTRWTKGTHEEHSS
jgi:hypothetical protein